MSPSPLRPARVHSCALWAVALVAACGSDPAPAPSTDATADAGALSCELGSEGCSCMGGSACQPELLCIAGRCLLGEEPSGTDPTQSARPPLNRGPSLYPPEVPDSGTPDAAAAPGGPPDASAPADGGLIPPDVSDAG
jgi:hypothetical protein